MSLDNTYKLLKNGLQIDTVIVNHDQVPVPVGHGWHPYFKTTGNVDNAFLQIDAMEFYTVDANLIPTGFKQPYETFYYSRQINESHLNHCFRVAGKKGVTAALTDSDHTHNVQLHTAGYPYIQVYTPPIGKSIAIEPMSCIPDALNNQTGLYILQPAEILRLVFQISLKQNNYAL